MKGKAAPPTPQQARDVGIGAQSGDQLRQHQRAQRSAKRSGKRSGKRD